MGGVQVLTLLFIIDRFKFPRGKQALSFPFNCSTACVFSPEESEQARKKNFPSNLKRAAFILPVFS